MGMGGRLGNSIDMPSFPFHHEAPIDFDQAPPPRSAPGFEPAPPPRSAPGYEVEPLPPLGGRVPAAKKLPWEVGPDAMADQAPPPPQPPLPVTPPFLESTMPFALGTVSGERSAIPPSFSKSNGGQMFALQVRTS